MIVSKYRGVSAAVSHVLVHQIATVASNQPSVKACHRSFLLYYYYYTTVICVSGIGAICGGMVYDSPCTAARAASACCLLQQPRAACCMQWSGVRFKLYEFMHVSCFQDVRICTACAVRQLVRSCQFDWSSDWPTQTNADKKIWSTST